MKHADGGHMIPVNTVFTVQDPAIMIGSTSTRLMKSPKNRTFYQSGRQHVL